MKKKEKQYTKYEYELDKDLVYSDAFGKSVILCNYETAKRILKIHHGPNNTYKGHHIYINNKMGGYKILPLKLNLKDFTKLDDIEKQEATYNAE